jgi:hypothetical protein
VQYALYIYIYGTTSIDRPPIYRPTINWPPIYQLPIHQPPIYRPSDTSTPNISTDDKSTDLLAEFYNIDPYNKSTLKKPCRALKNCKNRKKLQNSLCFGNNFCAFLQFFRWFFCDFSTIFCTIFSMIFLQFFLQYFLQFMCILTTNAAGNFRTIWPD